MCPVIFDTNVLLDFFVFKNVQSLPLWKAAEEGLFETVTTLEAVEEFADVLSRPQFELSAHDQKSILDRFMTTARLHPITAQAPVRCKDPLDQKFIDLLVSCAPALLVSKDKCVLRCAKKLKKFPVRIVPPQMAATAINESAA